MRQQVRPFLRHAFLRHIEVWRASDELFFGERPVERIPAEGHADD